MANGNTTTDALADSLPVVIASARAVREFEGVMTKLVDKVTLDEGTGLSWNEVTLAQLTAQAVTETTVLDNPQQLQDSLFTITPTQVGIQTIITDRVARRISKKAWAKQGSLAQNAMERKKDEDGLVVLDGATTALGAANTTLDAGVISAAGTRLSSNTVEPGMGKKRAVLHGFQIHDLYTEISTGLGTYPMPEGLSARVFQEGFKGHINGVEVFEDGNISIDANDDAKGGVFLQEGIVLVQGRNIKTETRRRPEIGGGATELFMYDEYAYGERLAANTTSTFLFEIISDATAPTA